MLVCKHVKEKLENYRQAGAVMPIVDITMFIPALLEDLEEPCDCADTIVEKIYKGTKGKTII